MARAMRSLLVAIACVAASTAGVRGQTPVWNQNPNCDPTGPPTFDIALRLDFSDLSPLVCPAMNSFIYAQGASFGLTRSLSSHQTSAAADGLLTATVRYYGASPFNGITFGAFAQVSGSYLLEPSAPQPFGSGTITPGVFTQFGFFNPIGPWGGLDNFRFRAGEVMASSGTRSTSLVGEWFPAYALPVPFFFGNRVDLPNAPLYYVLNPELMVQYDHFQGGPGKFLLFSQRSEALRIGPQVGLQLGIARERIPVFFSTEFGDFLAATTALIVYHTDVDVYTGKHYSSTSFSVTHNFSQHLGVSASYSTGNSEATGNIGASVKLGLSAKF